MARFSKVILGLCFLSSVATEAAAPSVAQQAGRFDAFWRARGLPSGLSVRTEVANRATQTPEARRTFAALENAGGAVSWPLQSGSGVAWQILVDPNLDRSERLTEDAFDLVLCHELSHGLQQAEGIDQRDPSYASELFADLYAVRRCLPNLWFRESPGKKDRRKRIEAAVESAMEHADSLVQARMSPDLSCRTRQLRELARSKPELLPCARAILGELGDRYARELRAY